MGSFWHLPVVALQDAGLQESVKGHSMALKGHVAAPATTTHVVLEQRFPLLQTTGTAWQVPVVTLQENGLQASVVVHWMRGLLHTYAEGLVMFLLHTPGVHRLPLSQVMFVTTHWPFWHT
jgi:hypothetical protein